MRKINAGLKGNETGFDDTASVKCPLHLHHCHSLAGGLGQAGDLAQSQPLHWKDAESKASLAGVSEADMQSWV